MKDFEKIKFNNGLRLLLVPQSSSLATTVLILVEAGSKYETKELNGLSHFLEHLCFKGTKKRPNQLAISRDLDALGADYNAFTAQEYTGYYAKARNENFEKVLEIVSDLYLNPLFDPLEIEKERGPIIEEINMYEDLPPHRVQDLFLELLYGDQPAGWNIAGTKENVLRFQKEDFLNYRQNHYKASSTILVIAGGFKRKGIEEKVLNYFEGINQGVKKEKLPVKEEQKKAQMNFLFKKTDQTHLVLGFRAFSINDPRSYILSVLADILGGGISSRLFQKIRSELGAAYYVKADVDLMSDSGFLGVSAGLNNKKITKAVAMMLEEFKRLKNEEIGLDELKITKERLIGHLFLSLESSYELASFYGLQEILKKELLTPQAIAAKIERVKIEEIKELAQEIFQNRNLNLSFIGPFDENSEVFKELNSLIENFD